MQKFFVLLPLVIALSIFSSCQKQQTAAERQAEIDREVQSKLDAEHQAQEKDQLAQQQSDLDAREKALAQKENARPATPAREREQRPQDRQVATTTASYDTFYSKLDQHGDWIETANYGYVFQPRQAQSSRNWRPYTDGRWVYSDVGWTWVSEEPFGWATYHYGRWTRLRNVGWVWVPGDEWAPAWVSWRKSDNYVGWAPLPPEARFDRRAGIHNWSDSYYDIGPDQYCFVETKQFGATRVEHTIVPAEQNVTIVNQTTNVTNITYNNTTVVNQGPSYDELRTRTQQPIERLRIERDVNVNVNVSEPRTVVRGEAVVIPAPLIARGQAVERPRTIKQTIANVVVERGWDAIQDRQAAEKVRVKMKAESTPPADLPPKTFVKAEQPAAAETTPSPARSTSSVAPAATVAPAVSAVESPTIAPRPSINPRPITRPTSTPVAPTAPAASPNESPAGSASPGQSPHGKFRSMRKEFEKNRETIPSISPIPAETIVPMTSASPTSPAAGASATPPRPKLESQAQKLNPRRVVPMESPSPSAGASTTPAGSPANESAAPPSRGEKRELRREEKAERKQERREGLTSPTPTLTPLGTPVDR